MRTFFSKKYNLLIWLTAFVLVIAFSSCQKCMRCTYSYKENYGDDKYKEYEAEECGSEEEISQFNQAMEFGASQYDTVPACVSW